MNFEKWKTEIEERALEVYKDPAVCRALAERRANDMESALIYFEKWVGLTSLLPREEALTKLNKRRKFISESIGKRLLVRAQEDDWTRIYMDIVDECSEKFMLKLLDAAVERVNTREGDAPLVAVTPSTFGVHAECLDQWWREDPTFAGLRETSELLYLPRKEIVTAIRAYRAQQQNEGKENA